MRQQLQLFTTFAAVLALNFALVGCTSKRDADIKDGQLKAEIFEIAELQEQSFKITTGESAAMAASQTHVLAKSEKPSAKIEATTAPVKLQPLLVRQVLSAKSASTYDIVTRVNKSYVTILKKVVDASELTALEKQLSQKTSGGLLVPVLKFRVTRVGVLERAKNDDGDKTSSLVLTDTPFANATHIQVSLNPEDSPSLVDAAPNRKALETVFSAEALDGKVSTLAALQTSLNFSLQGFQDGQVYTVVDRASGATAVLNIYRVKKEADIKDPRILAKLRGQMNLGDISYCADSLRTELGITNKTDCVIELAYQLHGDYVVATLDTNPDPFSNESIESNSISIDKVQGNKASGLVRFEKASVPAIRGSETSVVMSPYNTLRKADILGKEFFLRRTFEDGASTIMAFGPGASGDMDLVKFELKNGSSAGQGMLIVRKILAANGSTTTSDFDKEPLMQISVNLQKRDASSTKSVTNLVPAFVEDAEYISLNWADNKVDAANSPLSSTFGMGQCFSSQIDQDITDVDNRMSANGILNFTMKGTYNFRPDCISYYGTSDYWLEAKLQTAFELKERVSFKLNDGSMDKNPSYELPYNAQRVLGFGVWTANELVPNAAGNANTMANQKARMVIHDFSNGKQLTYVLGGLPESGPIREALIIGTKTVVEQWNQILSLSFRNTALSRDLRKDPPYIVLKVDGVDISKGHLGDLDRNYIWNYAKNLDSGLLGMSQPASNPRSGRIEQNNVLMYSGNVMSMIDYMKRNARLFADYEALKAKALAEQAETVQEQTQGSAAPGAQPGAGGTKLSFAGALKASENLLQSVEQKLGRAEKGNSKGSFTKPSLNAKIVEGYKEQSRAALTGTKPSGTRGSLALSGMNSSRAQQLMFGTETEAEKMFTARILKRVTAERATDDHVAISAIVDSELLKSFGKDMTPNARAALAMKSRRSALLAKFNKNFNSGARCAQIIRDSEGRVDLLKSTDEEIFKEFYMSTLSHEIGHSLGLTHNFEGSKDPANFRFSATEKTYNEGGRNYSSIMDYTSDDQRHYAGPGPYDMRAIRVAYTNLIELTNAVLKNAVAQADGSKVLKVTDRSGKAQTIKIHNAREITLDDLKKLTVGEGENWFNLSPGHVYNQKFSIRKYRYCNDRDAGYYIGCKRWDIGANDVEVMTNLIADYKKIYPVSGYRGDRVEYGYEQIGRYISRVVGSLVDMRLYMDESVFRALTEREVLADGKTPVWMETAVAALMSRDLLYGVLLTPTMPARFTDTSRFKKFDYEVCKTNDAGEPVMKPGSQTECEREARTELVEARPLDVIQINDEVDTMGFQFDKVIAMQLLSMRGVGHPRYESISLRLSYADFESIFSLAKSVDDSKILAPLKDILADRPLAAVLTQDSGAVQLPPTFEIESNDLIRFYASLSGTVLLKAEAMEESQNKAHLFSVGSTVNGNIPAIWSVSKLDQDPGLAATMKLWAMPGAAVSTELVRSAGQIRAMLNHEELLGKNLAELLTNTLENKTAEAKVNHDAALKILEDINQQGLLALPEEVAAGVTMEKYIAVTVNFMKAVKDLAENAAKVATDNKISAEDLQMILMDNNKTIAFQSKNLPILGLGMRALKSHLLITIPPQLTGGAILPGNVMDMLMAGNEKVLETSYGYTVGNLDIMNQIFVSLDPRFNQ